MADDASLHDRAKFTTMTEGTAEDWAAIGKATVAHRGQHVDRILDQLKLLDDDHGGFAVDRLEHSLQTATRAFKDGRDEEYVVCALLHDIGDILLPASHAEMGAALLKPYVSEANHWMLEKHGVFQGRFEHGSVHAVAILHGDGRTDLVGPPGPPPFRHGPWS